MPPGGGGRHSASGGQDGHLIIYSGPPAGLWWTWGGLAQRSPARTNHSVKWCHLTASIKTHCDMFMHDCGGFFVVWVLCTQSWGMHSISLLSRESLHRMQLWRQTQSSLHTRILLTPIQLVLHPLLEKIPLDMVTFYTCVANSYIYLIIPLPQLEKIPMNIVILYTLIRPATSSAWKITHGHNDSQRHAFGKCSKMSQFWSDHRALANFLLGQMDLTSEHTRWCRPMLA